MSPDEILELVRSNSKAGPYGCILWQGNSGKRIGPSITIKGKARSLRRLLWRATRYGLDDNQLVKAADTRCHWQCINLDHFHIEYNDAFYMQYK